MNILRAAEINLVMLSGRLTRDPEISKSDKYTNCKFGIAVNRRFKAKSGEWQDDTSFFNVIVWGDAAERLATRLKKGYAVVVEGKLKSNSWEKDGKKFSSVDVVANRVQVITKAEGAVDGSTQTSNEEPAVDAAESGEEIPF